MKFLKPIKVPFCQGITMAMLNNKILEASRCRENRIYVQNHIYGCF